MCILICAPPTPPPPPFPKETPPNILERIRRIPLAEKYA